MDKSVNNWTGFYDIAIQAHHHLLECQKAFKSTEGDEKWKHRNQVWMASMTSIVFSFIACESFLNYRAEMVMRNDLGTWKTFERQNILEKFACHVRVHGGEVAIA